MEPTTTLDNWKKAFVDSAAGGLPEMRETKARPPFSTGAKSGRKRHKQ
jgi:hypothetical protein